MSSAVSPGPYLFHSDKTAPQDFPLVWGLTDSVPARYRGGMRIPTELKRGLRQFGGREGLASELGVGSSTVWRWEHGQVMPEPARRLLLVRLEEAERG